MWKSATLLLGRVLTPTATRMTHSATFSPVRKLTMVVVTLGFMSLRDCVSEAEIIELAGVK